MNIYDFAMTMEEEGAELYRTLHRKVTNKGLKSILELLIQAEEQHYLTFKKMKDRQTPDTVQTDILRDTHDIFVEFAGEMKELTGVKDQVEWYREAREIEKKMESFYREKASEMTEEEQRTAFLAIAEEEKKHSFLLENIIEFVSRPRQWVEDAEFSQLREY